jgi:TolB protein
MQEQVESILEAIDIATGARRVIHRAPVRFEAPNWTLDGRHLLINQGGLLYRVSLLGGEPERLDTGDVRACNNDHGYSPDGRHLAISCGPNGSRIYVLPAGGGVPRLLVGESPAYWHGWSPDGRMLAYVGRHEADDFDIYVVPVEGGASRRLTSSPGLDDGPDYTPDGQWIYFNSERTGVMRLWRMRPDGSGQEQVTFDDAYADWFPHPSPDGRWLVWLSYAADVTGHPPYKDVALRIMPLAGGRPRVLTRLFGGQGTINVPSWSPDSRSVAFVSYRLA